MYEYETDMPGGITGVLSGQTPVLVEHSVKPPWGLIAALFAFTIFAAMTRRAFR